MRKKKIYVALSEFCKSNDRPRKILLEAGFEVEENLTGRRLRRDELAEALKGAVGVLAGVEPYDIDLLNSLSELRCISRCGIGTEAIDREAARKNDIAILTTPEEVVEPVAQMTLAMILALARNFPQHSQNFREGQWKKETGSLLSEWTVGLVGCGRIGRQVERYLRVFAPRVIVTDPALRAEQLPDGVEQMELSELLEQADLVSLHASRPAKEGPLIGVKELSGMKKGSRLVNTARGHLVDEKGLYEALKSGHITAAALDVFESEPYSGPLTKLSQVLCTPHVSTLTGASRIAMERRCSSNVVRFLLKQP